MAGVVLAVIVFVGGYFYIANSKSKPPPEPASDVIQTLSPASLGLSLTVSPDKKKIKIIIAKARDIKSIEYQLTYEADSTLEEQREGGEDRVQRGITGDAIMEPGESSYESPWLDLGSCSRNVCHYDKGVDSVDLTLKIVKKNGRTYQSEKKFDF